MIRKGNYTYISSRLYLIGNFHCLYILRVQEVRFKVHDPKAYSKGSTHENTVNVVRSAVPPPPPPHADEEPTPPHVLKAAKVLN